MRRRLVVSVDDSVCVGNAGCIATAPGTFELDANRQSVVVDPDAEPWERIVEAAENCPVSAISVRDGATDEVLAP